MPIDVEDAFVQIFQSNGNMTEYEAKEYMKNLQKTLRYQQECWS
jgi:sulfite reductase alpha subunit-like flavoprotein